MNGIINTKLEIQSILINVISVELLSGQSLEQSQIIFLKYATEEVWS